LKTSIEEEIIDLLDLLTFTLSSDFLDKWKSKYGERLLKSFQVKVIDSLKLQRPMDIQNLFKYFTVNLHYNPEIINSFFRDIDFDIYQPIIHGSLTQLRA
jgi:hypothetical protein